LFDPSVAQWLEARPMVERRSRPDHITGTSGATKAGDRSTFSAVAARLRNIADLPRGAKHTWRLSTMTDLFRLAAAILEIVAALIEVGRQLLTGK
jgi:hypothetical protein